MKEESLFRVFVGGLAPEVKEEELRDRFKSFGTTSDVCLFQKKTSDGVISKTFGYVNLTTTEQQLRKCFAIFGGTKWKGHSLKVQLAKDDFMKRLQKEWENPEPVKISKSRKRKQIDPIRSYEEYIAKSKSTKKAIPGIPLEGEKNWVIGKFGRPLPIVHINGKGSGRKFLKHDPSKHCHCIRRIATDVPEDRIDGLTWELDECQHLQDRIIRNKSITKKKDIANGVVELDGVDEEKESPKKKKKKKKASLESMEDVVNENERDTALLKTKDLNGNDSEELCNGAGELENDFEIASCENIEDKSDNESMEISSNINNISEDKESEESSESEDEEVLVNGTLKNIGDEPEDNGVSISSESEVDSEDEEDSQSDSGTIPGQPTFHTTSMIASTPFVVPCVKKNLRENPGDNIVATPKVAHNNSSLGKSIIEQLKSRSMAEPSTTGTPLPESKDSNVDSGSESEGERTNNFFDFDINDMNKGPKSNGGVSSSNESTDDSEGEEPINLFDFEFENLKGKKGTEFLSSFELRWEKEDVGEDSSGESSSEDSETDSDKSPKASKEGEKAVPEASSDEPVESESPQEDNAEPVKKKKKKSRKDTEDEQEEISETKSSSKKKKKEKESTLSSNDIDENLKLNLEIDESATQEMKSKKKKKKTEKENENETEESTASTKKEKRKKKKEKSACESQVKHHKPQDSEQLRQKSVEAHNQRTQQNKELIQNALRGLDTKDSSSANNKIRFSDTDDDDDEVTFQNLTTNEASSKNDSDDKGTKTKSNKDEKKSALWDGDSDESDDGGTMTRTKHKDEKTVDFLGDENDEDDEDEDENRFSVKPQFQGEHGKKLFKMQMHYGGDDRFRMDERFAEDDNGGDTDSEDEGEKSENKKRSIEREDEETKNLNAEEEKERNMSVLESILGKSLKHNKSKKELKKELIATSANPYQRYDPTKSDHTELEVEKEEKPSNSKKLNETSVGEKDVEEDEANPVPEVSKERFYKVETSLKSLFSGTATAAESEDKPAPAFTFLSAAPTNDDEEDDSGKVVNNTMDVDDDDGEDEETVDKAKPIKELSWKKGLREDRDNRDVSMENEKEEESEEKTKEGEGKSSSAGGFFFFKENDERLLKGASFMRSEGLEEITKQWEDIRQGLREDFRKKHKDAVRRVRKMKERKRVPNNR
ncbi:nucleolar protein 8-like [Clytia hemisphaerica]|uniref:nucleolar protein 8-like n=1 Tax=Clytia hemisphaerica TaxID=252671 RepID=UPI0034D42BFC